MRRTDISPLSRLIQRVDAVADGAPPADTFATGFPSLDRVLGGGLRRGDLVVLGGDVGVGKSALALAIALRMAQDARQVTFYSAEMSVERLMERAVAIEGRVRVDDLRTGALDEVSRAGVGAAAVRLRDHAPTFVPLPSGGAAGLGEALRQGLDVQAVVVDGLAAVAADARPQDEEVSSAVRRLKGIALELDIAVLVTAPVPRLARERADPRPELEDFGALGSIGQHADVVLALYREGMYRDGTGVEGATELLVRKNRNGATGYVDLYFYQQWMRFEDMLEPDR